MFLSDHSAPVQPLERRYVRVSGEATIRHVELFIRRKMELSPTCQVSHPGLQLISPQTGMTTVRIQIAASDRLGSRTAEELSTAQCRHPQ